MKSIGLLVFVLLSHVALGQQVIPLYTGTIPNAKKTPADYVEKIDSSGFIVRISIPTLTAYFADIKRATGTAVIIMPSGGYEVWVDEGADVARAFNKIGITAFVLKYRLPNDAIMIDKTIGPLQDAQRAMVIVRQRAAEWKIDPAKIGLIGISAGGHIASSAGTHFSTPVIEHGQVSVRPDFMILLYPVITFDPALVSKTRSRKNLLGETPTQQQVDFFSNENHVTTSTPPTWLIHAGDDQRISVKHSLLFYEALLKANVNAELHILPTGGHGFALEHPTRQDKWMNWCADWLQENGFGK